MKNKSLLFLLLLPFLSFAQKKVEQIEAAKIGLITNRLNLTTEESPQFWAVYNEFEGKRKDIRKSVNHAIEDAISLAATDDKILQAIKEYQLAKEKEISLEREFMPKFLKIISVRQYAELLRTERKFNQYLLNQLSEKRN